MIADPYLNHALVVELPYDERMALMSYEDWCYVVDRFFAQERVEGQNS